MRKDSTIIGLTTVLITAALIGGMFYLSEIRQPPQRPVEQATTWQTLTPQETQPIGTPGVFAETPNQRTSTPIKCHDPEVGEFWTNAATCDGADLYNRMSIAEPVLIRPERERYGNENYVDPRISAGRGGAELMASQKHKRRPDLRLTGKSPPSGLPAECKFPVGKALEIERALSAADDPRESVWREEYCEWRCEVLEDQCPIDDSYFYYRFRQVCAEENLNGC